MCYCGTGAYITHGEGKCDVECTGDKDMLCGGSSSNSVYAVVTGCAPAHLGCYSRDTANLLTAKVTSSPVMTLELCDSYCDGYDFFGVSRGKECYCGNDAFGKTGPSDDCNVACTGKEQEICGGEAGVSIYTATLNRPSGQPLC